MMRVTKRMLSAEVARLACTQTQLRRSERARVKQGKWQSDLQAAVEKHKADKKRLSAERDSLRSALIELGWTNEQVVSRLREIPAP